MVDRVWQYAGTFIVTVVGWILWCIFTQKGSFVPTVGDGIVYWRSGFRYLVEHRTVQIGL